MKNVFLYVFFVANIAISGYVVLQNIALKKSISYMSYDIERIEQNTKDTNQKVESVWGVLTSMYLKTDQ